MEKLTSIRFCFLRVGLYVSLSLVTLMHSLEGIGSAHAKNNTWNVCREAAQSIESETDIPQGLLETISLIETGRWSTLNQRSMAWPWTITSGTRHWYFSSKEEAIYHVNNLLNSGVKNIDIGCMQINLYHHGTEFLSLENALNPLSNVRYAASYLMKLRKSTSNWFDAAGNYHSTTPKYNKRYKEKLRKIMKKQTNINLSAIEHKSSDIRLKRIIREPVPIDVERTAKLNNAFKVRNISNFGSFSSSLDMLNNHQFSEEGADSGLGDNSNKPNFRQNYALKAQANRILKKLNSRRKIEKILREYENLGPQKRTSDLNAWRKLYFLRSNSF